MAVPASGAISLAKIRDEIENNNYNHSLYGYTSSSTSLGDISDGSIDTINTNNASADRPDGSAPHAMSEFYNYDHDKAASFSWTSPTLGFSYSPTAAFNIEAEDREGDMAVAKTTINITWNSNKTHTTSYTDSGQPSTGLSGDSTNAGGNIVTSTNTVSVLEARWVFVDVDIDFGSSADSNEKVVVEYFPGGSISSTSVDVRTHGQGDVNDLDYSDSWRTITPAVMGGSGSNSQSFSVKSQAQSYSSSSNDYVNVTTSDDANDYIGLQIRANQDNNTILTLRSNTSSGVSLEALGFEIPDFTCIMPDMIVKEQTKGYIRIGDVVVGDRILAKGDLNDSTVASTYAEVTEARTHTRSGYWNVEGLHITNDHPVWLDHNGTKGWVKVEEMWDGITRNYVAGTVDPVYLGTTPGHYYVYPVDKSQKFTVSGNYAPTTE